MLGSFRSPMEKRENELRAILVKLNSQRKKKTIVRKEKRYKYLLGPNGQISCGNTVAYLRQCRDTA